MFTPNTIGFNNAFGANTLLLDDYPGANLAFDLRKLRTAYTGNCIRVRRSTDNTEQDIGFLNNVIDTAALSAFCGGGDGYMKTWYNQSTFTNNATQTDNASQAKIYSAGSLVTENSKAALDFYSKFLSYNFDSRVTSTLFTTFWVCRRYENNNNGSIILGLSSNGGFYAGDNVDYGGVPFMNAGGFVVSTLIGNSTAGGVGVENVQHISYMNKKSTTEAVGQYNNSNNSYNTPGATLGNFDFNNIASYFGSNYGFFGKLQALINYPTDEAANRTGISDNINDYYSIY